MKRLMAAAVLVVALIALAFMFLTPAVQTHAQGYGHAVSSQAKVSGGGCAPTKIGNSYASIAGCISASGTTIKSDGYYKVTSQARYCRYLLWVVNKDTKTIVARVAANSCTVANNVHVLGPQVITKKHGHYFTIAAIGFVVSGTAYAFVSPSPVVTL